jgi:hypothetical protein
VEEYIFNFMCSCDDSKEKSLLYGEHEY